ncbi:MAG: hypothetical protein PVH88_00210 [Ignavibacteria bacterium]|jgi:alpha-N-arabinofuranosidase
MSKYVYLVTILCLLNIYRLYAQETDNFVVTNEIGVEKPISPLLYSNFIELGYGIQVESIWGEMLWNRSFEKFVPYKKINISWFDLYYDDKDWDKGYKTDWTLEEWHHSGYEHNAWFPGPGKIGNLPIDDNSTFFITETPKSSVYLSQDKGGIHGDHYLLIENKGSSPAAVAQEGKFLNARSSYMFRGHFKTSDAPANVELRMYKEGEWNTPLVTVPFQVDSKDSFQVNEFIFYNKKYTGRATFSLWIPGGTKVEMDALSFMPKNTIGGWRPEAVAVTDYIKPGVIRFPGGCFASFYDWKDGIGPYDERKPQPSYFWGGLNYNDVGVAEYVQLCKSVGSEMMYCVNVYHPLKEEWDHRWDDGTGWKMGFEFPQFTDIEKGAKEAADLVAYCNLPVGTHPMANLRHEHGYTQPFGIRYWELDNEVYRWFSPEEYAEAVKVYSEAMKAVDPTIKIGMVTYGKRPSGDEYGSVLPQMLKICGEDIDFLADRRDTDEGLDEMLRKLREYENKTGRFIAYCNTEKLFMDGKINFSDNSAERGTNKSFQFSKWFYAMNVLKDYLAFQRRGGNVWYVNFNNLANTHNQCAINTPKEGAFISAAGEALHLLSNSPAAWPLVIKDYKPRGNSEYVVQAVWSKNKSRLVLYVLNRTLEDKVVNIDISQLGKTFNSVDKIVMSADSHAMNTMELPESINKQTQTLSGLELEDSIQVNAGAFSFTQLILQ